ncbi:hypothetical protein M068_0192 [Bacteroides fragilis str. J38-1]|nr:hypothetical protein M068_0192 [Bacteroides fragilis str. J38-1]
MFLYVNSENVSLIYNNLLFDNLCSLLTFYSLDSNLLDIFCYLCSIII